MRARIGMSARIDMRARISTVPAGSGRAARLRPVTVRIGAKRGRPGRSVISFRLSLRACLVIAALVAAGLVISALTLSTGSYHVPLSDVVRTVFGDGSTLDRFIITRLREPRLLTALAVGAALGAGGALFQSVSRNPLGSPDIIGFDTGAATGALIVITLIHGTAAQTAAGAVLGGLATAAAVYFLAMRHGVHGYRLILVGIGVGALLSAVNGYLLIRASENDAQSAALWLIGSLNGRGWDYVGPEALALVVLLPAAWWISRALGVLELGDDLSRGLGLRVEWLRGTALLVGVALAASATAAAGPVGFVALSAPQIARRLTATAGPNTLTSALAGAVLLAGSDLAAQQFPTGLPVGVVTAVLGGLYLAWLLSREWRKGRP